jgi:hypothetical protein
MVSDGRPPGTEVSLSITHRWFKHLGAHKDTTSYSPAAADAMRTIEAEAGALGLSAHRDTSRSKSGGVHYGGGVAWNYVEIVTVAAATAASLAALLAKVSPIITALLAKSAGASVRLKRGDTEVELKGTGDVEKALAALRELEEGKQPKLFTVRK